MNKEILENLSIITSKEAAKANISRSTLTRLCNSGTIERITRGVYLNHLAKRQVPISIEDLISSVKSVKEGAICLISALSYYNLTDEIPRQHWIAVPDNFRPSPRNNVRFVSFKNYKLGLKSIKINGVSVKIYDQERTIVDSFKFLSFETAIKALKNYLKNNNPNIEKLYKYSKIRRINIEKYIQVILVDK